MQDESIKQYLDTMMVRGMYETAKETPVDSPLQYFLLMGWRQQERNKRLKVSHEQVMEAATGEN